MLDSLNKEQKKAVTFGAGPLMIVAGAGTGKTTVITKRISYLIMEKNVPADHILALTFTDQAAGEMEERVDCLLPYGYVDLWISTFHSFCERVLRENAIDIGLNDDFKVLDTTAQWILIRKNLDKFDLDYYRPLGNPTKFIRSMLNHFSRCKDQEISSKLYLEYVQKLQLDKDSLEGDDSLEISRLDEIANAYHLYNQLMLENNSLDFADLIRYTIKLFSQRPKILEKYRRRFEYVLVDEFQDTNWAQFQLIQMIAEPQNNINVVADDDQSVYHFRGASMSNILEFKKKYSDAVEIFLTQNYRSKQGILDLSYDFIQQNNPNRLEYQIRHGQPGFLKNISKKLISNVPGEAVVELLYQDSLEEEVEAVINKIIGLSQAEANTLWRDFAILIRANNQANVFMDALDNKGIPYSYVASRGLYGKTVIMDLLAYLRYVDDYYKDVCAYRVLSMPIWEMEHKDLMTIIQYSRRKGLSFFETCQKAEVLGLDEAAVKKTRKVCSLLESQASLAKNSTIRDVIFSFVREAGYLKYLESLGEKKYHENLTYLNQFLKIVNLFEKENSDKSIGSFIKYMDLVLEAGDEGALPADYDIDPDTVKIMTVHAAKGLEFKYVFVVNLVHLRFPSTEKHESIEIPRDLIKEHLPDGDIHLEEERRLFYVAITRAKEGVFFSCASDYGGKRKKKPSRFLLETGVFTKDTVTAVKEKKNNLLLQSISKPVLQAPKDINLLSLIPAKFSFTQLKTFQTCPRQYCYAHLLRVPTPGSAGLSFGKTMHNTLEKFFRRIIQNDQFQQVSLFGSQEHSGNIPSIDDLLMIFEENWIDDWYLDSKQKNRYKVKGRKILKDFYSLHEPDFPIPLFLEKGFNLRIGNYVVKGKVDRIDSLPDGTVEIVDYKTGKVPIDEKKVNKWNKNQLYIYQMAATEIFDLKVSKMTFYYLDENKPISFCVDEKQLEKVRVDIHDLIKKINEGNFLATPSAFFCKFCAYNAICEFRKF